MNNTRFLLLFMAMWCGEAHVCDIRYRPGSVGPFVNCSNIGLHDVPGDIPRGVDTLDLSHNMVSEIKDFTFGNFSDLTFLDLGDNKLERMEPKSLRGLHNLMFLSLSLNRLTATRISFPDGLFEDLKKLRVLYLEAVGITSYPDWVFCPLQNLKKLYIDSVPRPLFGPGFSHLTNLEFLKMDSLCAIQEIRNSTFVSFQNATIFTLEIRSCPKLTTIGKSAFEPLTSLTTLILSGNDIGLIQSLDILKPFVGRTMLKIDMSSVFPDRTFTFSTAFESFVTKNNTKYLTKICVKNLSSRQNNILFIEQNALLGGLFMKCIERLDMSRNNLLGDLRLIFMISSFSKLKYLSVGRQMSKGFTKRNSMASASDSGHMMITLPSSLQYVDATGFLRGHNPNYHVTLKNSENLKTFLFAYNSNKHPLMLSGLNSVEQLDLSGNNLDLMMRNSTFSKSFENVRTISVHDCKLSFGENVHGSFLSWKHLQYFDASRNYLTTFPLLPNPLELVLLNLSRNAFVDAPIDVTVYRNLRSLDMTFNSISYLDKITRNDLDDAFMKTNLSVHLFGNMFTCGCENLDFILWLVESPVVNESNRNFPCMLDNGFMTGTMDVVKNLTHFSRHCTGRLLLILTLTLGTSFFMFLIGLYVIAKNPTRYKNFVMRIFGLGPRMYLPEEFNFTFYIGYCEHDIPFVYQLLRPAFEQSHKGLFLRDREVLPGCDIADGIVEGVNCSWKTLLVVSREFLEDPWSNFTINTAVYSMTDLIPNRIIILLVGDAKVTDLPDTLLNAVDDEFILNLDKFNKGGRIGWNRIIEIAM